MCWRCTTLLDTPVTTPSGHSFCSTCIGRHSDAEKEKNKIHSCLRCHLTFNLRPVLHKSTLSTVLVEALKKSKLQAAPADHCHYGGAEEVTWDVCTGSKQKALKFCLDCCASYCDSHLQPHHQSTAFQRHKLVEPTQVLPQGDHCTSHNELRKIFCNTDLQANCFHCFWDRNTELCGARLALSGQRLREQCM